MEKFYQKKYENENLYATLCYDVGQDFVERYWADRILSIQEIEEAQDFIERYWAGCILSIQEIIKEKEKGESKFIIVFRRLGAELFPINKGVTERFSFYKDEGKEVKIFLLDYESESIYSLSWGEAEDVLNK